MCVRLWRRRIVLLIARPGGLSQTASALALFCLLKFGYTSFSSMYRL